MKIYCGYYKKEIDLTKDEKECNSCIVDEMDYCLYIEEIIESDNGDY
jgi:hypothetical protein